MIFNFLYKKNIYVCVIDYMIFFGIKKFLIKNREIVVVVIPKASKNYRKI